MSRKYGMLDIDKNTPGFPVIIVSRQAGYWLKFLMDTSKTDIKSALIWMARQWTYVNIMGISSMILNRLLPTTKMVKMDLSGVYTTLESLAQNRLFS